jgi:AcrR family transcriptional regulator
MGNREDLLAGALECLKEKGWARTTVRDIAAAAGVNHAAIGYHFGSRDALLTEAFISAMEEWGEAIAALVQQSIAVDAGPRERYEAFWRAAIESYVDHRKLWLASVEAAVQAEHSPRVRDLLAAGLREGRSGLAAGLLGIAEDTLDDAALRGIGSVQLALMSGVLMQWTLDPDNAPSATDLADGLIGLADRLRGNPKT